MVKAPNSPYKFSGIAMNERMRQKTDFRLSEFDFMRSLAIIFIVITHMHLIYETSFFNNYIFLGIGDWGLIIFFFISGFLLNYNNEIQTKGDIATFMKKRIKKIYPLYLISLLITYIMFVIFDFKKASLVYDLSIFSFIIHIVGLQGFIPHSYVPNHTFLIPAMWYISCILWYYLLYSIIVYYSKDMKSIIIYACFSMLPFVVMFFEFNLIQFRMFYYYPAFIIGIISSIISQENRQNKIKSYLIIGILLILAKVLIAFMIPYDIINSNIIYYFLIFIGMTYLKMRNHYSLNGKCTEIVSYVSYSSYAIYLFHFPILCFFKTLLDYTDGAQEFKSIILLLFGVPLLFLMSYYIQKKYDFMIERLML